VVDSWIATERRFEMMRRTRATHVFLTAVIGSLVACDITPELEENVVQADGAAGTNANEVAPAGSEERGGAGDFRREPGTPRAPDCLGGHSYEVVAGTNTHCTSTGTCDATAYCGLGRYALGGGCDIDGGDDFDDFPARIQETYNSGTSTWYCQTYSPEDGNYYLQAFVVCC